MSVKIFDTMTTATPNFPLAYAEKINIVKEDGTEDNLQNLFDNGELGGGGDSSATLTQEEYEALPEEDKLNGLYYTYDTKRIYKNGVQYGASEPIPLTVKEYKALKAAGAIDEKQGYLVEADAEGILLGAEDIGYNNAVSGIQATTVQGVIDKVAEKVDGLIDDTTSSTESTWSSSKIASTIPTTRSLTLKSGYNGYITEVYDPTTKVVVYNVNINGTFKGLGNAIAKGFKVPKGATSSSDVMHTALGIYGTKDVSTGDAQFTRLLVRSYGNPFLDVDIQGEYIINGTITYVTA